MKFENVTLENQDVILDGNEYHNCTMRHCVLIFRGTAPCALAGNDISDSIFALDGAAHLTIDYLRSLYAAGGGAREIAEGYIDDIRGITPKPLAPGNAGH